MEEYRERERKRERNRDRERERETEKQREREQQIINKMGIDTYLFVKWNKQIKLGRFKQKQHEKRCNKKCDLRKQHKQSDWR